MRLLVGKTTYLCHFTSIVVILIRVQEHHLIADIRYLHKLSAKIFVYVCSFSSAFLRQEIPDLNDITNTDTWGLHSTIIPKTFSHWREDGSLHLHPTRGAAPLTPQMYPPTSIIPHRLPTLRPPPPAHSC